MSSKQELQKRICELRGRCYKLLARVEKQNYLLYLQQGRMPDSENCDHIRIHAAEWDAEAEEYIGYCTQCGWPIELVRAGKE